MVRIIDLDAGMSLVPTGTAFDRDLSVDDDGGDYRSLRREIDAGFADPRAPAGGWSAPEPEPEPPAPNPYHPSSYWGDDTGNPYWEDDSGNIWLPDSSGQTGVWHDPNSQTYYDDGKDGGWLDEASFTARRQEKADLWNTAADDYSRLMQGLSEELPRIGAGADYAYGKAVEDWKLSGEAERARRQSGATAQSGGYFLDQRPETAFAPTEFEDWSKARDLQRIAQNGAGAVAPVAFEPAIAAQREDYFKNWLTKAENPYRKPPLEFETLSGAEAGLREQAGATQEALRGLPGFNLAREFKSTPQAFGAFMANVDKGLTENVPYFDTAMTAGQRYVGGPIAQMGKEAFKDIGRDVRKISDGDIAAAARVVGQVALAGRLGASALPALFIANEGRDAVDQGITSYYWDRYEANQRYLNDPNNNVLGRALYYTFSDPYTYLTPGVLKAGQGALKAKGLGSVGMAFRVAGEATGGASVPFMVGANVASQTAMEYAAREGWLDQLPTSALIVLGLSTAIAGGVGASVIAGSGPAIARGAYRTADVVALGSVKHHLEEELVRNGITQEQADATWTRALQRGGLPAYVELASQQLNVPAQQVWEWAGGVLMAGRIAAEKATTGELGASWVAIRDGVEQGLVPVRTAAHAVGVALGTMGSGFRDFSTGLMAREFGDTTPLNVEAHPMAIDKPGKKPAAAGVSVAAIETRLQSGERLTPEDLPVLLRSANTYYRALSGEAGNRLPGPERGAIIDALKAFGLAANAALTSPGTLSEANLSSLGSLYKGMLQKVVDLQRVTGQGVQDVPKVAVADAPRAPRRKRGGVPGAVETLPPLRVRPAAAVIEPEIPASQMAPADSGPLSAPIIKPAPHVADAAHHQPDRPWVHGDAYNRDPRLKKEAAEGTLADQARTVWAAAKNPMSAKNLDATITRLSADAGYLAERGYDVRELKKRIGELLVASSRRPTPDDTRAAFTIYNDPSTGIPRLFADLAEPAKLRTPKPAPISAVDSLLPPLRVETGPPPAAGKEFRIEPAKPEEAEPVVNESALRENLARLDTVEASSQRALDSGEMTKAAFDEQMSGIREVREATQTMLDALPEITAKAIAEEISTPEGAARLAQLERELHPEAPKEAPKAEAPKGLPIEQARTLAAQHERISPSLLERRLGVNHTDAQHLIDLLEEEGVLGAREEGASRRVVSKPREGMAPIPARTPAAAPTFAPKPEAPETAVKPATPASAATPPAAATPATPAPKAAAPEPKPKRTPAAKASSAEETTILRSRLKEVFTRYHKSPPHLAPRIEMLAALKKFTKDLRTANRRYVDNGKGELIPGGDIASGRVKEFLTDNSSAHETRAELIKAMEAKNAELVAAGKKPKDIPADTAGLLRKYELAVTALYKNPSDAAIMAEAKALWGRIAKELKFLGENATAKERRIEEPKDVLDRLGGEDGPTDADMAAAMDALQGKVKQGEKAEAQKPRGAPDAEQVPSARAYIEARLKGQGEKVVRRAREMMDNYERLLEVYPEDDALHAATWWQIDQMASRHRSLDFTRAGARGRNLSPIPTSSGQVSSVRWKELPPRAQTGSTLLSAPATASSTPAGILSGMNTPPAMLAAAGGGPPRRPPGLRNALRPPRSPKEVPGALMRYVRVVGGREIVAGAVAYWSAPDDWDEEYKVLAAVGGYALAHGAHAAIQRWRVGGMESRSNITGAPTATNVPLLKDINFNRSLSRGEQIRLWANQVAKVWGPNVKSGPDDKRQALPIKKVYAMATERYRLLREVIPALANLEADQWRTLLREFKFDTNGHVTNVDVPRELYERMGLDPEKAARHSLTDIAAHLPTYVTPRDEFGNSYLTPNQQHVLHLLQRRMEILENLAKADQKGRWRTRHDVDEGGFYIPRGNIDDVAFDIAQELTIQLPRSRTGGAHMADAKLNAPLASAGAGMQKGYRYLPLDEVIANHTTAFASNIVEQFWKKELLGLSTPSGEKVAQPSHHMNPLIKNQQDLLLNELAAARHNLAQAERIVGITGESSTELDRAVNKVTGRIPTRAGRLARVPGEISALNTLLSGTDMKGAADVINQLIPDDIKRIEYIDRTMDALRRRVNAIKAKGSLNEAYVEALGKHIEDLAEKRSIFKIVLDDARLKAGDIKPGYESGQLLGLQGYQLPKAYAQALKFAMDRHAVKSPSHWDAVNGFLRGMRATGDVSFTAIQGLAAVSYDPAAYNTAISPAYTTVFTHEEGARLVLGQFYLDHDVEGRHTFEVAEYLRRGLIQSGTVPSESVVPQGVAFKGHELDNVGVVRRSNRGFSVFGDILRIALMDNQVRMWEAAGREVTGEMLDDFAKVANRVSGVSRTRFGGKLGSAAFFAPRFMQSQFEVLYTALSSPNSIQGRNAQAVLAQLIGTGVLLTVFFNHVFDNEGTSFNPTDPNFMRVRIDAWDTDLNFFGPWDSLVRGIVKGAGLRSSDDGRGLKLPDSAGDIDLSYLMRSKASPLVGFGWDMLTGKNFFGDDVHRYPWDRDDSGAGKYIPFGIRYAFQQVTPFAFSGMEWNKAALFATAAGITGTKATPMTELERATRRLKEGSGFTSLDEGATSFKQLSELSQLRIRTGDVKAAEVLSKGVSGDLKEAREEAKAESAKADENFIKGNLSPSGAPFTVADWLAVYKEQGQKVMAITAAEFGGDTDWRELPDSSPRKWVGAWYDTFKQAGAVEGQPFDPNVLERLQNEWFATYMNKDAPITWVDRDGKTKTPLDYIDLFTLTGDSSLRNEYQAAMMTLRDDGYFDMPHKKGWTREQEHFADTIYSYARAKLQLPLDNNEDVLEKVMVWLSKNEKEPYGNTGQTMGEYFDMAPSKIRRLVYANAKDEADNEVYLRYRFTHKREVSWLLPTSLFENVAPR